MHIASAPVVRRVPRHPNRGLLLTVIATAVFWAGCDVDEEVVEDDAVRVSAAEPAAPAPAPAATPDPTRTQVHSKQRGPFLRFEDTLWDWGVVPAGEELRHLFVLHNDGDEPVLIKKARPTCGCTAVAYDREIAPGDSGVLEVVVNGKKLHRGKSTVYVEIETNDPRSDTALILRGEVTPDPTFGAIKVDAGLLVR